METKFNFWKENKLTGFFQLTDVELIKKFSEWMKTKEVEWLDYYSTSNVVSLFVSEGLNAIGNTENNFKEYKLMEALLQPIKRNYIESNRAKQPTC